MLTLPLITHTHTHTHSLHGPQIHVPASLGYGEKGVKGVVPSDSDLVFSVTVLKSHDMGNEYVATFLWFVFMVFEVEIFEGIMLWHLGLVGLVIYFRRRWKRWSVKREAQRILDLDSKPRMYCKGEV